MNRELSSLKSFFRFLRMRKEVDSDIFINISSLKTPKMLPSFVPQTKMASVLDDIRTQSYELSYKSQRDSLIIALFYSCGLRLAELCSLRMSDFDSSSTSIKVLGKGDKQRIIPIVKELSARVERYKECLRNDGIPVSLDSALIVNRKGTPLSRATIQRVVQSELSKSMVQGKKSPHVLRHTFATHLLDGQADMRDIQELMGHASLRTTQHYTHNSISQLQKVYEKAHPRK